MDCVRRSTYTRGHDVMGVTENNLLWGVLMLLFCPKYQMFHGVVNTLTLTELFAPCFAPGFALPSRCAT